MDKKQYQTPQLQTLGSVEELTKQPDAATVGSVDLCEPIDKLDNSGIICGSS